MQSHPLREPALAEMHLRQMPPLTVPCRVMQVVRLPIQAEREAEREAVSHIAPEQHLDLDARHISGAVNGCFAAWERHSEASTALIVLPGGYDATAEQGAVAWLEGLPGKVMRATRLDIVADMDAAEPLVQAARFSPLEMVSCDIRGGHIWSDFRLGPDERYGRTVFAASSAHPSDLGRIVQQLQELGNYRNLALMGLATAQQHGAEVTAIETELARAVARFGDADDRALLNDLTSLAGRVAALRAQTEYRMSATAAYGRIVQDRLGSLAPRSVPGYQNLAEFTERRLLPALRTCESFRCRLEAVALRIEQATGLMRTRVDLALQDQNAALLQSMERSAARQLRLQHLVEGLSVLALSYYAIGLVGHLLLGAEALHWLHVSSEIVLGVAVLPILLMLGMLVRWRSHAASGHIHTD
ncbi:putative membrane-anchored protein [Stakelama sediminis]|uniref:Putative membrane-anchored protein n=2 Tax=Stakelama sediminis TaxID=463200 RepID=A0A840YY72_9SPHN|nr:putative membrane-anchored protein [Stakelama sediminis]